MVRGWRKRGATWWIGGVVLTTTALIMNCNLIVGIDPLSGDNLTQDGGGTGAGGASGGPGGPGSGGGGGNVSSADGSSASSSNASGSSVGTSGVGSSSSGASTSGASSSGSGGAMPCTMCEWDQAAISTGTLKALNLASDTDGDVVLVGSLDGTVNFGNMLTSNGQDIFVTKLDQGGSPLWAKNFGDASLQQEATGVAINKVDHSIIFVGHFNGAVTVGSMLTSIEPVTTDVLIAKLQSDGTPVWGKRFGNPSSQLARGVALDGGGNIVTVGYFEGSIDFTSNASNVHTSSGLSDIFVAKLDKNGMYMWSKKFGDGNDQRALGVAVDASDNIIITGYFRGMIDFGCSVLTASGLVDDLFVAKLASDGSCVWSKAFGDANGVQQGRSIAADSMGDVLVTGEFSGTLDFKTGINPLLIATDARDAFVVKMSGTTGNAIWSASLPGSKDQVGTSIAADATKNVLVTGSTQGDFSFGGKSLVNAGATDAFVVWFDTMGTPLCGDLFGDADAQAGTAIKSDAAGSAIFATNFAGSVNVCGPETSQGPSNILVSKVTLVP